MFDRNRRYEDLHSMRSDQRNNSFPRHAVSRDALLGVLAQRDFALPHWPVFLLIAVIDEIAAYAVASVLHLGTTATGIAIAGVVLSAMWPLVRSAF
jgi:hypothetical protein